jgi:hypothetical protein
LFSDRLPEQAQSRLGNQSFFSLPLTIINQVILETAEAHAVPAEDIAGFETLAQLPVSSRAGCFCVTEVGLLLSSPAIG